MGIRAAAVVVRVKQMLQQTPRRKQHHGHHPRNSSSSDVPMTKKGHFAVYVGAEMEMKRFVVPIAYLQHPLFQSLLHSAEEEYGFDSPGGVLRVPCNENAFALLASQINY